MLFASLKSEHEGTLITIIFCHTYDTAWHLANQLFRAAHITHIRATELHGYTQRLTITNGNISTPLTRCLQYGEVGSHTIHDKECLILVTSISKTRVVLNNTNSIWLLNDNTCHTALSETDLKISDISHTVFFRNRHEFDSLMQRISVKHLAGIGVQSLRHKHLINFLTCSHSHHHRLSTGSSTVVHRGIADVHTCQLSHHALILKDIMQGTLRDLCLIGSIRREELRALQQAG